MSFFQRLSIFQKSRYNAAIIIKELENLFFRFLKNLVTKHPVKRNERAISNVFYVHFVFIFNRFSYLQTKWSKSN